MTDLEFPTNIYVFEGFRKYGAEIVVVPSDDVMRTNLDRLLDAIDERTILVPLSLVLFRSSCIQDARAVIEKDPDEDLKLLALRRLCEQDEERCVPLVKRFIENPAYTQKSKESVMFVLAQSNSARAREVLRNYAKGSSTPELQSQAIQYLGVHGGAEHRALLAEIYSTTSDVDVKRRILRAFMQSNDKERLFKAAQSSPAEGGTRTGRT